MTLLLDTETDIASRSPAFYERRQFGRRAAFKRSKICLRDGAERDCIVIDLSEGGARIRLIGDYVPPDSFELKIPDDDMIVHCEVAHRTDTTVGVRFSRAPRRISWLKANAKPGLTDRRASGKGER